MPKPIYARDALAPPIGPFSPSVSAGGFVHLSGQAAQDPATGWLVEGDAAAQAEQVLCNVAAVVAAAGKGMADVGVFLTDMADFQAVNAVYARHFAPPYPARTTVAVAALPLGAAVEIDLVTG